MGVGFPDNRCILGNNLNDFFDCLVINIAYANKLLLWFLGEAIKLSWSFWLALYYIKHVKFAALEVLSSLFSHLFLFMFLIIARKAHKTYCAIDFMMQLRLVRRCYSFHADCWKHKHKGEQVRQNTECRAAAFLWIKRLSTWVFCICLTSEPVKRFAVSYFNPIWFIG